MFPTLFKDMGATNARSGRPINFRKTAATTTNTARAVTAAPAITEKDDNAICPAERWEMTRVG